MEWWNGGKVELWGDGTSLPKLLNAES